MSIFYTISIKLYYLVILLVSIFNNKAKKWINGRKKIFDKLTTNTDNKSKSVWFHCASLGEFEQGRPVIEMFNKKFSDYKIYISFFSPSGYEIRKNYKYADYVFYLPIDSPSNAKKLVKIIKPDLVFFVKYEFWYHYICELHRNNIKIYSISALFRSNQIFFRWYGKWYKKILFYFEHIFVQNNKSKDLLVQHNVKNVSVSGDTRFDRVISLSKNKKKLPIIEKFTENSLTFIAGSSWQPDEEIFINYINTKSPNIKYIIAPHEIHSSNIERITKMINKKIVRYSKSNIETIHNYQVLIIDNIGMLSSIYNYCDIAYIGGGFGQSIHNIQEPASYGMPIIFGTNYHKFKEAIDLIKLKAAFSIENYSEFEKILETLVSNSKYLNNCSLIAQKYIDEKKGASEKIINYIKKNVLS